MIYIPTSLDQPVGAAFGIQAGFAEAIIVDHPRWLSQSPQGRGGFAHLRLRSTETSIHRHDHPEARLAGHHFRVGLSRFLYRVVSILAETPLNTLKRSFVFSRQAHANKSPVEADLSASIASNPNALAAPCRGLPPPNPPTVVRFPCRKHLAAKHCEAEYRRGGRKTVWPRRRSS